MDKLGYERVHGGYGFGNRHEDGESVLNFALAFDLMVAKLCIKRGRSI